MLRVLPIDTNESFARVSGEILIPASSGVFAGSPLTTGATAAPVVTVISGALNTLVDTGALTTTEAALNDSAGVNNTTPAGALTTGEALGDGEELGTGDAGVSTKDGVGVGVGAVTTTDGEEPPPLELPEPPVSPPEPLPEPEPEPPGSDVNSRIGRARCGLPS